MEPLLFVASQLLDHLPDFLNLLADDQGGSVKEEVETVIKKATGSENPAEWQQKIDTDPQLTAQLRKDLAALAIEELRERGRMKQDAWEIEVELTRLDAEERERVRQEEFQRYLLDLQDRRDARSMEMRLAEDHNPLAWVAPIMAFALIALIFYLLRGMLIAREPVVDKDVFNVVLGALVTAFTTVVSYYFGSSAGSRQKDEALTSGRMMLNPTFRESASAGQDRGGNDAELSAATPGGGPVTPNAPALAPGRKPQPATPQPPPSGRLGLFRQKAPGVMRDLIRDLDLTTIQAAGILGNIGVECAGFRLLQEQRPLKGGRGGWGWCQWTGPRRRAFEKWANENNLNFSDDSTNYGYLLVELKGEYARCVRSLKQTSTVDAATTDFMNTFEKPAARYAGLQNRIRLAQLALQEYTRAYHG